MKKLFIVLIFVVGTTICAQAQKQIYAGGSFGLDFGGNKGQSSKGPSFGFFYLSPMAGYCLFDKLSVGTQLTLGFGSNNSRNESSNGSYKKRAFLWGFAPFGRYTLIEVGKLSLLAEGRISIQGASTKQGYKGDMSKGPSVTEFSITAMPLLTFGFTPKLNLEAHFNLFRFGFGVATTKYSGGGKSTDSFFGMGVNSTSIPEEAAGLIGGSNALKAPMFEIGMTYKLF